MLKNNLIAKIIVRIISPIITLYGLYILINGENSPGGGFQSGAIFATNFIILDMTGLIGISSKFEKFLLFCSSLGVLIYSIVGLTSFCYGANFLNYSVLSKDKLLGHYVGIFIVEIGIAITIASVLSVLYLSFKEKD